MSPANAWGAAYAGPMGRASRAKRERRESLFLDAQRRRIAGVCLFCKQSERAFTGREHPFPESLGNKEIVLPSGIVCDVCNNGPLSLVDKAICEFMPIRVRRTMLGVTTKAGQVPKSRLFSGLIENTGPGSVSFVQTGSKAMLRETFRDGDTVGLQSEFTGGRRLTPRYVAEISRGLLKCALELAWLDHGDRMYDPDFDHVRDAVLGLPFAGFVVMGNKGEPDHTDVTMTYGLRETDGPQQIWVVAEYFGVTLSTDSRWTEPPVDVDGVASVLTFKPTDFKRAANTAA
jgi:hypothetical protein